MLGRFDDADTPTTAAELERSAGFPPLVAPTEYWLARTLLDRMVRGIEKALVRSSRRHRRD